MQKSTPNYFYGKNTGNSNLRRHLYKIHPEEYDRAIVDNNWDYKLSTHSDGASTHQNAHNLRNQDLPQFSPATFLEQLVRFVVADDQVRVTFAPGTKHESEGPRVRPPRVRRDPTPGPSNMTDVADEPAEDALEQAEHDEDPDGDTPMLTAEETHVMGRMISGL
jgi:hypothetical protein